MMEQKLIQEAMKVREKAYAPYSKFKVGAALLTKAGTIFTGCNVENASYGLTVCAERIAIFKAVSEGEKEFEAISVVTDVDELTPPCGACLQVMIEFNPKMKVILANTKGESKTFSLDELIPIQFSFKS